MSARDAHDGSDAWMCHNRCDTRGGLETPFYQTPRPSFIFQPPIHLRLLLLVPIQSHTQFDYPSILHLTQHSLSPFHSDHAGMMVRGHDKQRTGPNIVSTRSKKKNDQGGLARAIRGANSSLALFITFLHLHLDRHTSTLSHHPHPLGQGIHGVNTS